MFDRFSLRCWINPERTHHTTVLERERDSSWAFLFPAKNWRGGEGEWLQILSTERSTEPRLFQKEKFTEGRFCCTRELSPLQKGAFIQLSKEAASCRKSRGLPKAFLTRGLLTGWWEETYFGIGLSTGHCSKTRCELATLWRKRQWFKINMFLVWRKRHVPDILCSFDLRVGIVFY